jgi:hypothetical protein
MINARLDATDVELLRSCIIPKKIHAAYPNVAQFYFLAMLEFLAEKFKDAPEALRDWEGP